MTNKHMRSGTCVHTHTLTRGWRRQRHRGARTNAERLHALSQGGKGSKVPFSLPLLMLVMLYIVSVGGG